MKNMVANISNSTVVVAVVSALIQSRIVLEFRMTKHGKKGLYKQKFIQK